MLSTFKEVIELWGKRATFTLALDLGLPQTNVSKWWQRDWIPPEHWDDLISASKRRRLGVKLNDLSRIASKRRAAA
jgi:hypothetical protein